MKNLRGLREARKMTMKALGQMIGVAESTISLYETGKREPEIATLAHLSEIFGVPIDFLVADNGLCWGHSDLYEDYSKCTDKEKLRFVELNGIDYSIASDYFRILGKTGISSEPPEDMDAALKFALFGGDGEITDEMFDEVKRFAAYIKQREQDKKG